MKHLLHLALLFIALNAAAQANFQTGYVVTNNNDTIKGFINYKNPEYTIQTVIAKTSAETKIATSYTADDLKSLFIVPSNFYISYKGRISNNKNNAPDIDAVKDTTTTFASIFLLRVISGPNVSLYVNRDKLKTRFFLKEKSTAPVELLYYQYGNPADKPHIVTAFTDQLTELYNRYNGVNSKKSLLLQSTPFTQAGLENAVNLINNYVPDKDPLPTYSRFFIGASFASVHSTTDLSNTYGSSPKLSNTSIAPAVNLGLDLGNNPGVNKAALRAELSLSYLKATFPFSYTPNGVNKIDNNTYGFDRYSLSLIPQFLYNFYNAPTFKFFMGVGASLNFCMYNNQVVNYYKITSATPYTLSPATDNTISYANFQAGVPIQAGIVLDRAIELAVIYSPPVTIGKQFPLTYQSIGVGIHYLFKHKEIPAE